MNKEVIKQEQDDSVIYIQKVIEALYENSDPVSVEAAELLERINVKQGQDEPWLLNTAKNLAKFMAKNFYPEVTHWKVSDNLVSVILQIDNMVTGFIYKSKQEQDEPWGTYMGHRLTPEGTKEFWGFADAPLIEGTKLYTTPQQRKPLTDDEFLKLLLRKGNSELMHYTTFVGGSIQMQGKIGLLKSAKVIKEFIEECYGIKE